MKIGFFTLCSASEIHSSIKKGSVAERSKALVLGTSLFGGVGSNPTAAILLNCVRQMFYRIKSYQIYKTFAAGWFWKYLNFLHRFESEIENEAQMMIDDPDHQTSSHYQQSVPFTGQAKILGNVYSTNVVDPLKNVWSSLFQWSAETQWRIPSSHISLCYPACWTPCTGSWGRFPFNFFFTLPNFTTCGIPS